VELIESGTITNAAAKQVFETVFESGRSPRAIVDESGVTTISDPAVLEAVAERVIDANPKPVADYRGGKHETINVLFGQVMRETNKRADAAVVREILQRLLNS
jgi:aspartyl-tRNA(Asn)/glutamyl-tRNA(Gln) amidotransferase subunit B